jgi:hypothetical protein
MDEAAEGEDNAGQRGERGTVCEKHRHKQKGDAVQSVARSVDTVNRK